MTRVQVRRVVGSTLAAALVGAVIATGIAGVSGAVPGLLAPATTSQPNLSVLLGGFSDDWSASGRGDLHGTVHDAATLQRNDELAVWINQHATAAQRFRALQDAQYDTDGGTYDQSITISTGLGSVLGPAYVTGRTSGRLPLTAALLNSSNGTSGAFVGTGTPKSFFSYPRPFLPSDPSTPAVAGDIVACTPAVTNASSLQSIRVGRPYADARGNLLITRVPVATDSTHEFSVNDVVLDAAYGTSSLCTSGSFPSGHTTTAYQAGITLATLLPELAPEILARASENGNDRIVLGVHYPLDIIGGRISGEAAIAARWSDAGYRTSVLLPARAELLAYLEQATGHDLAWNVAHETPYRADPYGGTAMPGGTAQVVTDRASALQVYTERMTYGFPTSGAAGGSGASAGSGATGTAWVPAGAANLLLTTFPTLTDAQRTSILAQTSIGPGYPLDRSVSSGSGAGSWQRLNLAAAMSATVRVASGGKVTVVSTGGAARVLGG